MLDQIFLSCGTSMVIIDEVTLTLPIATEWNDGGTTTPSDPAPLETDES